MIRILSLVIFITFISCDNLINKTSNPQVVAELKQLSEEQDYFKLKSEFEVLKNKLSKSHTLYFSAIINNVFNKAEESNQDIKTLLGNRVVEVSDTMLNKLYRTKLLNHINLYEYGEAARTSELIQKKYKYLNDSTEIEMLQNEIKIWQALKDIPKQEVIKNKSANIPMVKDKVGLFNIDATFEDKVLNFIFDTGANFSVIKRSLVKELNLKLIEADFYVTAATGAHVDSDIAIADSFRIGDIVVKNAVFLILEDEDLSFPQIGFFPNGAIGFPVIEAMDEIRISNKNKIFVPQNPVQYSFDNFALDGLMPIIAVRYNGDTLRFHFDTGATSTSLFPEFFHDYKQDIEQNYKIEMFTAGSAGGSFKFEGYVIDKLQLNVADSEATLDSLRLHIENIGGDESNFHGNFGQDYISQFEEMVISFKYASILFK